MASRTCSTPSCSTPITRHSKLGLCVTCANEAKRKHPLPPADAGEALAKDRAERQARLDQTTLKKRYDEAMRTIEHLTRALDARASLENVQDTLVIEPRRASRTSEGTVVAVASDWHVEEIVGPEVGGLNRYSPQIAEARARQFFQAVQRLTQLLQQDITITQAVIPLLGDFITNDIHDAESAEMNALLPTVALSKAQGFIIGGLEFLLAQFPTMTFVVPCHSGNHSRTTHKTRFSAENGHSLEYLMYLHLAAYFRHEKRITFIIPEGYHSYLQVYDQTIRFHHGHAVKYGGGVGGIYIPVNKAVANWNIAKHADLDVFGHFHQYIDGGRFICNGSLIGYNGFALAIKAPFEPPRQALFLLDKKRGRTANWPILFSQKERP